MYLHRTQRRKNGKDHEYWSIVESRRLANGRTVQRHVLYLGEINSAQERAWARSIEVLTDDHPEPQTMADPHKLYGCHDLLLAHKTALFSHLTQRWRDLFNASFDVLLYDLTSTYFECDPPAEEQDKRKFGYSRDKRPDCVQVVIALIVTPEGFPLAYEVLSGNTSDQTTQLQGMKLCNKDLLMKLGAAPQQSPSAWRLVEVPIDADAATFTYRLRKDKLRQVRRREGRYLLRSNLTETDPAVVWSYYLQLVQVEQAFRTLKSDLAVRPIFHQDPARIEAHIFVSFLAYCLHVTLGRWLQGLAPGLTSRSALEKFAGIQMVGVHIPTADGRTLILQRYTHPELELRLLLERLKLTLPVQPPPRITVTPVQTEPPM
jgi:hypothetical protein